MNDKEFLNMCRNIDFSASSDSQKVYTYTITKNKISKQEKTNMKRVRKPMALVAIVAVLLSVTTIAVVATPNWIRRDVVIITGEEYVRNISIYESSDGVLFGIDIDRDGGGGPIIAEVDGETWVIRDELHFDNLDEALALLAHDSILLPTTLPEGFEFYRATFPVNPLIHTDVEQRAAYNMFFMLTNGDDTIQVMLSGWEEDWGIPVFGGNQRDVTINGMTGAVADSGLLMYNNNVMYSISTESLSQDELIQLAESFQ